MIPQPIRRALLLSVTSALVATSGSSLASSTSSANVGDELRAGDQTRIQALIGSTGCMELRGLSDSEVQGYQIIESYRGGNSTEERGRERWREGETKRFDFRNSAIMVLSGSVEITEINRSGGGCPDRLGLRVG
ncbi:hypothetical protein TVD_07620 [Thioalkalivibrio versutus]|uniref:Uncharacterized protein n=1 Tax=Thioalkalivibrio versutus TaxID=106634 RepID=A0A0G3G8U4_9GAMM|nr:hypothetical protein [Thioalkalivibrio versutus]AKJ95236.1 hypothetical protein TVD_07620 [Thioalkalivibrio versutus]